MIRNNTNDKGFTFNEILIAMGITSIVVLGYSATIMTVIRGNRVSESYTMALSLAQDKMEELRGRDRLDNEDHCPGDSSVYTAAGPRRVFKRCWRAFDSVLGPDLKQVEVAVTWTEPENGSVILTTYSFQE
jgi:Tfp pilus assembly protein PilV